MTFFKNINYYSNNITFVIIFDTLTIYQKNWLKNGSGQPDPYQNNTCFDPLPNLLHLPPLIEMCMSYKSVRFLKLMIKSRDELTFCKSLIRLYNFMYKSS